MFSLADITYYIRTIGKYAAIVVGGFLLLFLGFKAVQFVLLTIHPAPLTPPEMAFGKLEPIEFPTQQKVVAEYKINTLTGSLPQFPDRVRIYKMFSPEREFSALQNSRNKALGLQFAFSETKDPINANLYSWQDNKGNVLKYNISNHNFEILPNPNAQMGGVVEGSFPSKGKLITKAQSILANLEVPMDDAEILEENIVFLQNSGTALFPAPNENSATAVRLYITYKDIAKDATVSTEENKTTLPVVYPKDNSTSVSSLHITFLAQGENTSVFQAKVEKNTIDLSAYSEYGIISTQEAFKKLQSGDAYFISSNTSSSIDITDVRLAYYIGPDIQPYVLPVIVFEGKDFIAYVNALAAY